MTLTPVSIVRLASVPVGIAVGMFAPGLCILCGVVAAALVIMVSLALPRPGPR